MLGRWVLTAWWADEGTAMIVSEPRVVHFLFFSGKASTVRCSFHTYPAERNLLTNFLSGNFLSVNWSFYWWLFLYDEAYFGVFYATCFRFWDLRHSFWLSISICLENFQIWKAIKHKHTLKYTICGWFSCTRNVTLVSKWKNIAVILRRWHEVAAIMLSGGGRAWAAICKRS